MYTCRIYIYIYAKYIYIPNLFVQNIHIYIYVVSAYVVNIPVLIAFRCMHKVLRAKCVRVLLQGPACWKALAPARAGPCHTPQKEAIFDTLLIDIIICLSVYVVPMIRYLISVVE